MYVPPFLVNGDSSDLILQVVEQESACLCDVNKCGICATHSQMNKFPSPEHRNYIPVRDKIESFKCAAEDTLYRRQQGKL